MALMKHVQAFEAGHYKGVFFLFEQEIDFLHYKKLFDAKEWPLYRRNKKSGIISSLHDHFVPDEVKDFRRCFVFMHESIKI